MQARTIVLSSFLALLPLGLAAAPAPVSPPAVDAAMAGPPCDPANAAQVRLRVDVRGLHSTQGNVTITIYPDDAAHFLDGKYKVARQHLPVTLPVTQACIVMPAPGFYAVALFHDERNAGHFETTALGLPADGFGFSNNPKLLFGPPSLAKVRFAAHAGDNVVNVDIRYF